MHNITVSVIIPAYNEEKNIEGILDRTNEVMGASGFPFEVIVIDDGSTDKTGQLIDKHKATLLNYGQNKGKGYALQKGIQKATGNIIVTMDADGSHQPEEIPKLLAPLLNGADVVVGSRFIGTREKGAVKKLNIIGNHAFNLLILLLTRNRTTDSQTGFRALKRKILEEIQITSHRYQVETEITIKTLRNGYTIKEETITCEKRKHGSTHVHPLHDGVKILKTILKIGLIQRQ